MSRMVVFCLLVVTVFVSLPAWSLPQKGDTVESFSTNGLDGRLVNLDQILEGNPDLVILFFFTTDTGERVAMKLRRLDLMYGKDKLKAVGIGCRDKVESVRTFAESFGLSFPVVVDSVELGIEKKFGPFEALPVTFVLDKNKMVQSVFSGGTDAEASLISEIATGCFQQRKIEEAKALADVAVETGEDRKTAGEIKGFALTAEGKLDDAQAEFGRIDSKAGLAKVALERKQYEQAVALADLAGESNGYAVTVKGMAQMLSGKLDDAASTLDLAVAKSVVDWQKSEALAAVGRVQQEKGNTDTAIQRYEQAVQLDPYNVVALSNEGVAYRQKGDLKKAEVVLEKAEKTRSDELTAVLLEEVRKELGQANDVRRGELIRSQIADLRQRFEVMKTAGKGKSADRWTTPPLVVAILPSPVSQGVVLERAGMDVALRHELEGRLQASGMRVVEREVLDKLLQELNLGSSELAAADTQLQLGKVLSARMLGFMDFSVAGADTVLYVRFVDTESTDIAVQITKELKDLSNIRAAMDEVAVEITKKLVGNRPLQGLVADVQGDDNVIVNLGRQHGVVEGKMFLVLKDGAPIEAGGKVLGYRQVAVAELEVVQVEDGYAVCRVVSKQDGTVLAKDMKIKQQKKGER